VNNGSGFLLFSKLQTTCGVLRLSLIQQNPNTMKSYETLVDATQDLNKRGYTANLTLDGDTINDNSNNIQMTADDFEIKEFYRFEGATNPSDMSIVYAIESQKYNLKGVLVNAYGTYANNSSSAIEAKLNHPQIEASNHP